MEPPRRRRHRLSAGQLFADGTDRKHYAVVTNLDWHGGKLLAWHREKAGTVEHVHDEIKSALGGGRMPSQRLGVNAAWFTIALLAYNVASATVVCVSSRPSARRASSATGCWWCTWPGT